MSIKKIIAVDNEERKAGSIGSRGFKGEGAPQGRIGHRRHERQMRKAEKCVAYVGEAREPDRE